MIRRNVFLAVVVAFASAVVFAGCAKDSFEIRDVEPDRGNTVRSLGPESMDAIRVADLMTRSLLENHVITEAETAPTIVMLPMENNTRFPFNKEVFTTRLKAQLNTQSNGQMYFVARDILDDIQAEREAKREGDVDYRPEMRTRATAGADYFLKGRVDGLSEASRKGQAEYAIYAFKLVDAESGIEVWENFYEVAREGKDDVIYR